MKRQYSDPVYKKFRLDVLRRDNRKCQMPGCGRRNNLQVHHIQKWANASSLRYDQSNGITLCAYCHKSITGKESHYENLFREIVNGKI